MHCVDLGESFQTHIYLQNFVSKQPRTSPVKSLPQTATVPCPASAPRGPSRRRNLRTLLMFPEGSNRLHLQMARRIRRIRRSQRTDLICSSNIIIGRRNFFLFFLDAAAASERLPPQKSRMAAVAEASPAEAAGKIDARRCRLVAATPRAATHFAEYTTA